MNTRILQVAIRRKAGLQIKPEAEQIDGNIYTFRYGWKIEDDDRRYPGEIAWIPDDENYPIRTCPTWIASGDLKDLRLPVVPGNQVELIRAASKEVSMASVIRRNT